MAQGGVEREIKLAVADVAAVLGRIEGLGFRLVRGRTFEGNDVWDREDLRLRKEAVVLRIRESGGRWTVTYKGRDEDRGRHKVREEVEFELSPEAAGKLGEIWKRLGFRRVFRYEKYRREYTDGAGVVTLDETPIGDYLELEGEGEWIDRVAGELGYREGDYITKSYGQLYRDWCGKNGLEPADMIYGDRPERP